jgi:hypothetical protein
MQSGIFERSQCLAIGQDNRSIEALIPGRGFPVKCSTDEPRP